MHDASSNVTEPGRGVPEDMLKICAQTSGAGRSHVLRFRTAPASGSGSEARPPSQAALVPVARLHPSSWPLRVLLRAAETAPASPPCSACRALALAAQWRSVANTASRASHSGLPARAANWFSAWVTSLIERASSSARHKPSPSLRGLSDGQRDRAGWSTRGDPPCSGDPRAGSSPGRSAGLARTLEEFLVGEHLAFGLD